MCSLDTVAISNGRNKKPQGQNHRTKLAIGFMQLYLALFTILVVVVWATAVTLVPVASRIVAKRNMHNAKLSFV